MAKRRRVPERVVTELLTRCGRRCCLCYGLLADQQVKDGQIAHLDDDPANNALSNLAWLCLQHHAELHQRSVMTKPITKAEVEAHRSRLEQAIRADDQKAGKKPLPLIIPFPGTFHTTVGNNNTVINSTGRVYYNSRVVHRNTISPGSEHIAPGQALEIRRRIHELATLELEAGRAYSPQKWYSKLYRAFAITSYLLTPVERYNDVVEWLRKQAALLRPTLRRSSKSAWRKHTYTAIWARASELGLSKPEVYEFAASRLGLSATPASLTELGERRLDRLRELLFTRSHST